MRLAAVTGLGIMLLALGGCVSLPEPEAEPERYVLNPIPPAGEGVRASAPGGLGLAMPEVDPGLDSRRIAVIRGDRRLSHYADAVWAAPLPDLLRAFFAGSIENRLGITPWRQGASRLELTTVVRAFQAEYPDSREEPPVLRVVLVAALRDGRTGEVVARTREIRRRPAAANRLDAVTGGLEALLRDAFVAVLETVSPHLDRRQGAAARQ